MATVEVTCDYCGRKNEISRGAFNQHNRRELKHFFCNLKCSSKFHTKVAFVEITCSMCGKRKKVRAADYRHKVKRGQERWFCDEKCARLFRKVVILAKDKRVIIKKRKFCEKCGKEIHRGRYCTEHKYEKFRKESPPKSQQLTVRIKRKCLRCDRPFLAKGRLNRLCPRCTKYSQDGGHASSYDPQYRIVGSERKGAMRSD